MVFIDTQVKRMQVLWQSALLLGVDFLKDANAIPKAMKEVTCIAKEQVCVFSFNVCRQASESHI